MYEEPWVLAAAFGAAMLLASGLQGSPAWAQVAKAPMAASAPASAPATALQAHARSVKREREGACKSMHGDEKKACEKQAAADARKAAHRARHAASGASGGGA